MVTAMRAPDLVSYPQYEAGVSNVEHAACCRWFTHKLKSVSVCSTDGISPHFVCSALKMEAAGLSETFFSCILNYFVTSQLRLLNLVWDVLNTLIYSRVP